jgi:hypothetical protein
LSAFAELRLIAATVGWLFIIAITLPRRHYALLRHCFAGYLLRQRIAAVAADASDEPQIHAASCR